MTLKKVLRIFVYFATDGVRCEPSTASRMNSHLFSRHSATVSDVQLKSSVIQCVYIYMSVQFFYSGYS